MVSYFALLKLAILEVMKMSKLIPLTKGDFAIVDNKDYDYLIQFKWQSSHGYAKRDVKRKNVMMHRVINNTPDGMETDHINHNRRSNLRTVTHMQNSANRRRHKDKEFGQYKGSLWTPLLKRWRSVIFIDGKRIYLGIFDTELEAAIAYDDYAKEHLGEFAKLNFEGKTLSVN
jgi:hypothetical protein